MRGPKPIPIKKRFFRHVNKTKTCWFWNGDVYNTGYGRIRIGSGSRKKVAAHRLSFEIHKGPIPKGFFILHTCNFKKCVNPKHLYAKDNKSWMS